MTIEIKELIIKAVVDENDLSSPTSSQTSPNGSEFDEQAVVALCVEQVLAILDRELQR